MDCEVLKRGENDQLKVQKQLSSLKQRPSSDNNTFHLKKTKFQPKS